MKTILEHSFRIKSHDLNGLFMGIGTISNLVTRIEEQSMIDPLRYDPQKYKGDAFEFFVELFLMLNPNDKYIGVYEYSPVASNDNGVDGTGKNVTGDKCVVQIKYKSNPTEFLEGSKDHLANMFSDGMLAHDVVADMRNKDNFRHFIFTTAEGLTTYTATEMFKSKVKCFAYNDFKRFVNGNTMFWNEVRTIVSNL